MPLDTYSSAVATKMGNLLLTFVEHGEDPEEVAINPAIAQVAGALSY
jgi:hypothetical protein